MEPADYFILAVFIALGLFSLIAALFNLDWYFNTSGASTFVHKLGRGGARIFYALLGLALIACGVRAYHKKSPAMRTSLMAGEDLKRIDHHRNISTWQL